jgi:hypothetical protein
LEIIRNLSNNHLLFIINKKGNPIQKENKLADTKIKFIKENFSVSPIFINLSEFSKNYESIQKFLSNLLITKLGEMNNLNKLKISGQSNSKVSSRKSKSPTILKKPANSDTNSPNRFEISKSLNLTQKRTRSVKKNLGEIFEKLNLESI